MNINYFGILQQYSEKIKQLDERIELLENENEIMALNCSYKDYKLNSTSLCLLTNKHHRFISSYRGVRQEHLHVSQFSLTTEELKYFKNLEHLSLECFMYESLRDCNVQSSSITSLTIMPAYQVTKCSKFCNNSNSYGFIGDKYFATEISTVKCSLMGLEMFPNLETLTIFRGYGIFDIFNAITYCSNKIKSIYLDQCYLMNLDEFNKLKKYCDDKKIGFACYFCKFHNIALEDKTCEIKFKYYSVEEGNEIFKEAINTIEDDIPWYNQIRVEQPYE